MGTNERLNDGVVYARRRRCPGGRMQGRYHLLAATLAPKRNRNTDYHSSAVSAEFWPAGMTDADLVGCHSAAR